MALILPDLRCCSHSKTLRRTLFDNPENPPAGPQCFWKLIPPKAADHGHHDEVGRPVVPEYTKQPRIMRKHRSTKLRKLAGSLFELKNSLHRGLFN